MDAAGRRCAVVNKGSDAQSMWVMAAERNPPHYGQYNVIVRRRSTNTFDRYLWNGAYWVTPGKNPTKAVIQWLDTEVEGDE